MSLKKAHKIAGLGSLTLPNQASLTKNLILEIKFFMSYVLRFSVQLLQRVHGKCTAFMRHFTDLLNHLKHSTKGVLTYVFCIISFKCFFLMATELWIFFSSLQNGFELFPINTEIFLAA